MVYRIVKPETFIKSDLGRCKKLLWIAVPNSHDTRGFRRLMRRADGIEIYGAYQIILQVASKCEPRWTLVKDGAPLTANDISDIAGGRSKTYEKAFNVLCSKDIHWIEQISTDSALTAYPEASGNLHTTGQDRTETGQDKTEQKAVGVEPSGSQPRNLPDSSHTGQAASTASDSKIWGTKGAIRYDSDAKTFIGITPEHIARWKNAYPLVRVDDFLVMMASKVFANRLTWGRKSNYERAIENWLSKQQDDSRGGSHGRPQQYTGKVLSGGSAVDDPERPRAKVVKLEDLPVQDAPGPFVGPIPI